MEVLLGILCGCLVSATGDGTLARFELNEVTGHAWTDELVHFPVRFEPGACSPDAALLLDERGAAAPFQWSEMRVHDDGSVSEASVSFLADLPAHASREWRLVPTDRAEPTPSGIKVDSSSTGEWSLPGGAQVTRLSASTLTEDGEPLISALLPTGQYEWDEPVPVGQAPAPLLAVNQGNGDWLGRGWMSGEAKVTRWESTVQQEGPLFVETETDYTFEGGGRYTVRLKLLANQPVVLVEESTHMPNHGNVSLRLEPEALPEMPRFCFSLYEGLRPDAGRWRGHHASSPAKGMLADGSRYVESHARSEGEARQRLDFSQDQWGFVLMGWQTWWDDALNYYTAYRAGGAPDSPAMGVFRRHSGAWRNGHRASMHLQIRRQPDLYLECPVNDEVTRQWGLFVADKADAIPTSQDEPSLACRLMMKLGENPLDKVKTWGEWDAQGSFPRLYTDKAGLAALRELWQANPDLWEKVWNESAYDRPVSAFICSDSAEDARQLRTEAEARLQEQISELLRGWGDLGFRFHYWHGTNHAMRTALWLDMLLSWDGLEPADRERLIGLTAFLGHKVWDEDHVPYRAGFHLGNPNMPYMTMGARAIWAALLRELPEASGWANQAADYFTEGLQQMIHPEGGHMSCPHYIEASLDPALSALLPLQRAGFVRPFKGQHRWARFAEWYLNLITPRDPRFAYRALPSEGDGSTETTYLHAVLAKALRDVQPELSARLMWAWHAQERDLSSFHIPSYLMIDPTLPAQKPQLASRQLPGFGAVLRHRFGKSDESYALFVHRNFTHDHCHTDHGSFILYALGAPLCLDWGSIYYPQATQAWYHNRLSWGHLENGSRQPPFGIAPGTPHQDGRCYYEQRDVGGVEHAVEPFTAWQEKYGPHGGVTHFASTPEVDYAEGEITVDRFDEVPYSADTPQGWRANVSLPHVPCEPFRWQRQMLFVKAERPYLVLRDRLLGDAIPESAFSLWVLANEVRAGGQRLDLPHDDAAPTPHGALAMPLEFVGKWGVDLSVWVLGEGQSIALGEWGHSWHPSSAQSRFEKLHGRPFEERQVLLRVFDPRSQGFLSVLYPHYPGEVSPEVSPLPDGTGVRLRFAEREDILICAADRGLHTGEGWAFEGRVGLVRLGMDGDHTQVVLDD